MGKEVHSGDRAGWQLTEQPDHQRPFLSRENRTTLGYEGNGAGRLVRRSTLWQLAHHLKQWGHSFQFGIGSRITSNDGAIFYFDNKTAVGFEGMGGVVLSGDRFDDSGPISSNGEDILFHSK